jgi:hypothetical protein
MGKRKSFISGKRNFQILKHSVFRASFKSFISKKHFGRLRLLCFARNHVWNNLVREHDITNFFFTFCNRLVRRSPVRALEAFLQDSCFSEQSTVLVFLFVNKAMKKPSPSSTGSVRSKCCAAQKRNKHAC